MNTAVSPLVVTADYRETNTPLYKHLAGSESIHLTTRKLDVGDYVLANRIVCERKTIPDFAVSIIDGRLFRQAVKLGSCRLQRVMIIEGKRSADRRHVSREAMQGALVSITLVYGIPVLRAADAAETMKLFQIIAGQTRIRQTRRVKRYGYKPRTLRRQRLYMLQGLPGVGPEIAERLLNCFGSIQGVCTASAEELHEVNGIGKRKAEKIGTVVK